MDTLLLDKTPVKVANEFIESRYSYTANEIDLMCHVLAKIQQVTARGSQYTQIVIDLQHICDHMGDSNANYTYIRAAIRGLLSKPVEIYDKEARQYSLGNIISFGRVDIRRGIVLLNIDPFMLPLLLDLKKEFTIFQLSSILRMTGKHSKRIYLMCSQFKNRTLTIELDEFKKRLGLENLYLRYSDLYTRVLETAISEINEKSDLDVVLISTPHKGLTVTSITIDILQKKKIHELSIEREQEKYMFKIGLAEWQILNVFQVLKREQVHPILVRANEIFRGPHAGNIKSKSAYLVKMFERENVPMNKQLPVQLSLTENLATGIYAEYKNRPDRKHDSN